ncbi:MAG: 3'-5' exonuclease [Thermodesulfatator sp.]|nr:MAG: 3'-5' exonuclease [Thermodesulfatator sp.]
MPLIDKIASLWRRSHPVIQENHAYFQNFDQTGTLLDYDFVVFDTELTGLNSRKDEIVSIGAVRIRGLRIIMSENFYVFVKPEGELPKDSTLIHRITPEQIKNAPPIEEVLEDFVRFCNGSLIVGHYIDLDMGFMNKATRRILGGIMANPCIDTLRLAQVYREEQWGNYYDQFNYNISFNLADLAKEYNLPQMDQHDAFQDAIQTAYLFLFLIKKLKKGGITTLKDLYLAGRSWRWLF